VICRGVQVHLYVWKESEIYMKRDPNMYIKRPRYTWIETLKNVIWHRLFQGFWVIRRGVQLYLYVYVYVRNETNIYIQRDICMYSKSPTIHQKSPTKVKIDVWNLYVWNETQICMKRDLCMYLYLKRDVLMLRGVQTTWQLLSKKHLIYMNESCHT